MEMHLVGTDLSSPGPYRSRFPFIDSVPQSLLTWSIAHKDVINRSLPIAWNVMLGEMLAKKRQHAAPRILSSLGVVGSACIVEKGVLRIRVDFDVVNDVIFAKFDI